MRGNATLATGPLPQRRTGYGKVAFSLWSVGAAPHLPAGILSPYSDGERDDVVAAFANHWRRRSSET
ncbi:MAG: hypothetical protein E5Y02_09115 [Mesorhizobium sp.]|nr:MAG: hypothetical protein E5Y02_09115 [Mesorhizobium sp.]